MKKTEFVLERFDKNIKISSISSWQYEAIDSYLNKLNAMKNENLSDLEIDNQMIQDYM